MTCPTQDTRHAGRIHAAKGVTDFDRSPKVHLVISPMLSAEIYAVLIFQRRESTPPTMATTTPLKLSLWMRARVVSE
jgi:hypothetical protein